jgi:hypothetical protein
MLRAPTRYSCSRKPLPSFDRAKQHGHGESQSTTRFGPAFWQNATASSHHVGYRNISRSFVGCNSVQRHS